MHALFTLQKIEFPLLLQFLIKSQSKPTPEISFLENCIISIVIFFREYWIATSDSQFHSDSEANTDPRQLSLSSLKLKFCVKKMSFWRILKAYNNSAPTVCLILVTLYVVTLPFCTPLEHECGILGLLYLFYPPNKILQFSFEQYSRSNGIPSKPNKNTTSQTNSGHTSCNFKCNFYIYMKAHA